MKKIIPVVVLFFAFTIFFVISIILSVCGEAVSTSNYVISGVGMGVCLIFLLGSLIMFKVLKNKEKAEEELNVKETAIKQEKAKLGELYLTTREKKALNDLVNSAPPEGSKCPICGSSLIFSEATVTCYERQNVKLEGVYRVAGNTAFDVYQNKEVPVEKPCNRYRCPKCKYEWDRFTYLHTYTLGKDDFQEKSEFVTKSNVRWGDLKKFME